MFCAHVAFTLQAALLGAGLVVWHYGRKEMSISMKLASLIMVVIGLLGLACSTYWYMQMDKEGMWKDPKAMFRMMEENMKPSSRR